jgi:uncharacterized protein YcfJ
MRKLILIGTAAAALSLATPVLAAEEGAIVGGTAGAWTGGTIGFLLGGPVGAFVGGTTGAVIGGGVGDSIDDDYRDNRGIVVEGRIRIGDIVSEDVRLRGISGEPDYGYFRADGQIFIVDRDTREVVDIRNG